MHKIKKNIYKKFNKLQNIKNMKEKTSKDQFQRLNVKAFYTSIKLLDVFKSH